MEISAAAVWLNTAFAGFDLGITLAINNLYHIAGWLLGPLFEFISFLGSPVQITLICIVLSLFKKTRRFGIAMLISLMVGALITNGILKVLIARPRPYADTASEFYKLWLTVGMHTESDKSFPSGHTTAIFSTMTAVFLVGRKNISWTAYIFAVLMAISRVYLVVHYPTDVIVGVLVGIVGGIIGTIVIARRIPEEVYSFDIIKPKKGKHEKCSD